MKKDNDDEVLPVNFRPDMDNAKALDMAKSLTGRTKTQLINLFIRNKIDEVIEPLLPPSAVAQWKAFRANSASASLQTKKEEKAVFPKKPRRQRGE